MPTNQKKTSILDFSIITSAYGHSAINRYLQDNSILYIDPNKKRTNDLLSLNGLQLPVGENQYGSIRRIAYADGKVKIQNPIHMTQMQEKLFAVGVIDEYGNIKKQSRDADYLSAVERGDMDTAQRMVDEAAKAAGYGVDASWRMDHKAPNSKDGVRLDQIDRAYNSDGSIYSRNAAYYYGDGRGYDNKAIEAIRKAKDNPDAFISVYRAVPTQIKDKRIRNGDWVTVDREYAEEHGWRMFDDAYRVIENKVPARHLFTDGNSIHEFGYDNGNKNEVYRNTENNVKLATVTYDDNGDIIPLSERFNPEQKDIRYQARYAKQGGEYSDALTGAEWTKFNHAMLTKADSGLRVSDNSILVECEEGNIYDYKFIIYDNSFEDNPIDSVYAIGNLGYNIPEANEIAKYVQGVEERRYARQKVLKELLKRHAEKFGYVLRRYNTKTRRFNNIGGTLTKNREDFIRQSVGAGFINRAGQFVKYDDSRNMDLYGEEDDLFGAEYDTDEIQDVFARHYLTHSEAIGEVLRNTADIEIAPNTFKNIVGRVLKEDLGNVDTKTKKDLAVRIQLELENAKNADPENIVNNMIAAVRNRDL